MNNCSICSLFFLLLKRRDKDKEEEPAVNGHDAQEVRHVDSNDLIA